jgi:hypothetical protein
MKVEMRCQHCSEVLSVKEEFLGQSVRCPICQGSTNAVPLVEVVMDAVPAALQEGAILAGEPLDVVPLASPVAPLPPRREGNKREVSQRQGARVSAALLSFVAGLALILFLGIAVAGAFIYWRMSVRRLEVLKVQAEQQAERARREEQARLEALKAQEQAERAREELKAQKEAERAREKLPARRQAEQARQQERARREEVTDQERIDLLARVAGLKEPPGAKEQSRVPEVLLRLTELIAEVNMTRDPGERARLQEEIRRTEEDLQKEMIKLQRLKREARPAGNRR